MSPTYVALDLETTGLDSSRDAIIEIGAVKFDERRTLGTFSTLVNPGRPIPLKVTQLTGITNQDVVTAPPFSAVYDRLTHFVGRAVVVGHSVNMDLAFLRRQRCLTRNRSIDTFQLAGILMPHESRYSLGKLTDSLGIPSETHHRALEDAQASMHLFQELLEQATNLPAQTLETINRAAAGSRWPLRSVFRQAERRQRQGSFESSIGAQLRAKGLIDDQPLWTPELPTQPLIPVDRRTALDSDRLTRMLEEGGELAGAFPGFEYRPQQIEMMQAVAAAFNSSRHLLVEAGTGIGKSVAYLLPAIHWAVQNGERVVVSTNTINLQEQLQEKDIPDLQQILPFEVRAAVLKGRGNYLCMRRLRSVQRQTDLSDPELTLLAKVLVWLPNTVTGDRTELFMPDSREQEAWARVCSDSNSCTMDRCVYRRQGTCFFHRARQTAENAHIIIVNHALLLSDVATENRVLPQYGFLIVDEAHHLEDATTYQLGYSISRRQVEALLDQFGYGTGRRGHLDRIILQCQERISEQALSELRSMVESLSETSQRVRSEVEDLFEALTAFVAEQGGNRGQYDYRVRLTRSLRLSPEWEQIEVIWDGLASGMRVVHYAFAEVLDALRDQEGAKIPGYESLVQDGVGLEREFQAALGQLESVLMEPEGSEVTWVQARARANEIELCAVPLRVGRLVEQHLLWAKEAVIFTSATLRTGGDFNFIRERLGAIDAEELAVGSPFDYESQVLLYLPTDIPEPNQPFHNKTLCESLIELARATRGRLLALFTSYSQLRTVNSNITRPLADAGIAVYAQGQGASRTQLLENFRAPSRSVLLGTRSFWEGIDVPGPALSCVVLTKLPFAVPSDPVFAARSEDVDDPFYQYAVPDAILRFRQGFGRLVRTKSDRGVVVVMDRRLQTKRYGELFLRSLPECTRVRDSVVHLPRVAAQWIDEGTIDIQQSVESNGDTRSDLDDDELEYVPFEDL